MNARAQPSDFRPLTTARRARIERTIELLIAWLDAADGEADLEPTLAGFETSSHDDREGGDECESDLADSPNDLEDGDDNGIADSDGVMDQWAGSSERFNWHGFAI